MVVQGGSSSDKSVLGICVCFKSFWLASAAIQEQISSSGQNRAKWAKKKNLLTTSLWLLSAEMLYPGCEFLFPQAARMFAQSSRNCASPSPVLLLLLLGCVLCPPAQASKVGDTEPCVGHSRVGCEGTEPCPLPHMAPVSCRALRTFAASASAPRTATSVGTSTTRMCPRRTGECERAASGVGP